ncbi:PaaI family thioesterase [Thermoplasma sp.]|uniref:PaaI family thioesterase n=1 Tax=Thermoplasma sp. TaxID=1973142 RepID=UPI00126B7AD1|nr:PaaI family thioesterase [Thermoplasma sp.]KAA8922751.1 MAG: PaaI family thioesterase [Thermoplasma sp.]
MFDGEDLKKIFAMDGFLRNIEFDVSYISEGSIEIKVPLRENLIRIGDIMNGGAIMAISDAIGGLTVLTYGTVINQVTVNFSTEFIRQIGKGPVVFRSRMVRIGKNIAYVDVEALDGDGQLCSKSMGTYYIYR